MTGEAFIARIAKTNPAPVYLFLGPDAYRREQARRALIERVLPPDERESGLIRHDLDEETLAAVIDDARAYSLFSPRRLLWVSSAEGVLPRGRAAAAADADGETSSGKASASVLADYVRDPAPDVTIVFDSCKFSFEGDEKAKVERLRKFYAAIPEVVEFAPFDRSSAIRLALELARRAKLQLGEDEAELLADALASDAARIATEIEKLSLYTKGGKVTREDLAALVPDARAATIFALVEALSRRDRIHALEILDTLVREGEYLPLALTFLATQFRLALVAKENRLANAQQVQAYFTRLGTQMWRSRAEQVYLTSSKFSREKLEQAVKAIARTDRALRDTRPEDRVIMEEFVLKLTDR